MKSVENPPSEENFIIIQTYPYVRLSLAKSLNFKQGTGIVKKQPKELVGKNISNADFTSLFGQFTINKKKLEDRIGVLLQARKKVSLRDVLEEYTVEDGLAEIVTYLTIASQSPRHIINGKFPIKIPIDQDLKK